MSFLTMIVRGLVAANEMEYGVWHMAHSKQSTVVVTFINTAFGFSMVGTSVYLYNYHLRGCAARGAVDFFVVSYKFA